MSLLGGPSRPKPWQTSTHKRSNHHSSEWAEVQLLSKDNQVSIVLRHLLEVCERFIIGLKKLLSSPLELKPVDSSLLDLQIFLISQRRSGHELFLRSLHPPGFPAQEHGWSFPQRSSCRKNSSLARSTCLLASLLSLGDKLLEEEEVKVRASAGSPQGVEVQVKFHLQCTLGNSCVHFALIWTSFANKIAYNF